MILYNSSSIEYIKGYHFILVDYHQLNYVMLNKVHDITKTLNKECEYFVLTYPIHKQNFHFLDEIRELAIECDYFVLFVILPNEMIQEDYKALLEFVYLNKNFIRFVFIPVNHDEIYLSNLSCLLNRYINIKVIDGRKESADYVFLHICNCFETYNINVNKLKDKIYKYEQYLLENTYLNEDELEHRCFDDLIKKGFEEKKKCHKKSLF